MSEGLLSTGPTPSSFPRSMFLTYFRCKVEHSIFTRNKRFSVANIVKRDILTGFTHIFAFAHTVCNNIIRNRYQQQILPSCLQLDGVALLVQNTPDETLQPQIDPFPLHYFTSPHFWKPRCTYQKKIFFLKSANKANNRSFSATYGFSGLANMN